MNKSELIDALRAETWLSKRKAEQVVALFFDEISKSLVNGNRVEIRDFCNFNVKDYEGYTGRNPKTGKLIEVAPKKLPFFRCGKELKERVDYKEHEMQEGGKAT